VRSATVSLLDTAVRFRDFFSDRQSAGDRFPGSPPQNPGAERIPQKFSQDGTTRHAASQNLCQEAAISRIKIGKQGIHIARETVSFDRETTHNIHQRGCCDIRQEMMEVRCVANEWSA
jgi:hypothetical protein